MSWQDSHYKQNVQYSSDPVWWLQIRVQKRIAQLEGGLSATRR